MPNLSVVNGLSIGNSIGESILGDSRQLTVPALIKPDWDTIQKTVLIQMDNPNQDNPTSSMSCLLYCIQNRNSWLVSESIFGTHPSIRI